MDTWGLLSQYGQYAYSYLIPFPNSLICNCNLSLSISSPVSELSSLRHRATLMFLTSLAGVCLTQSLPGSCQCFSCSGSKRCPRTCKHCVPAIQLHFGLRWRPLFCLGSPHVRPLMSNRLKPSPVHHLPRCPLVPCGTSGVTCLVPDPESKNPVVGTLG